MILKEEYYSECKAYVLQINKLTDCLYNMFLDKIDIVVGTALFRK